MELTEPFPIITKKKKKNQARWEVLRQNPLTLTLLLDVPERHVALKGLRGEVSVKSRPRGRKNLNQNQRQTNTSHCPTKNYLQK